MIELHITKTSKSYAPASQWFTFDHEQRNFQTMAKAKAWLRDRYGKSKQRPMYQDKKDGTSYRCGVVIGFRESMGNERWLEQHWVRFRECSTLDLDQD